VKAKPNGVTPEEGVTVGPEGMPSFLTEYVSIILVAFSVTTKDLPSGLKEICAGPGAAPTLLLLHERVDPANAVNLPNESTVKPEILPLPKSSNLFTPTRVHTASPKG
jgi:hypothetical protein